MNILVAKNGSQLGPFSESDIRAKLASGELAPTDPGWKEGMAAWSPLSQILSDAPSPSAAPQRQNAFAPVVPSSSPQPQLYTPSRAPLNNTTASKQQYLDAMRAKTAYPTYRGIIGTIEILGYILAGLQALSAVIFGLYAMSNSFIAGLGTLLIGLVVAALVFLGARFWKEAATILADIGDSITEANSRGQ